MRVGAPVARGPGGRVGGGGRAAVPFSFALGGGPWPQALSPSLSGAPPLGIHGSPGGRGRRARSGRPPVGQCGGGGGRGFPAMACSPAFPRRASRRAASSASPGATLQLRPTEPAQSRRPAVGYAGVSGRPTGGA